MSALSLHLSFDEKKLEEDLQSDLRKLKMQHKLMLHELRQCARRENCLTNDTIKTAVLVWCDYPRSVEDLYGKIHEWDTSMVTDMSNLFNADRFLGSNDDLYGFMRDLAKENASKAANAAFLGGDHNTHSTWNTGRVVTMKKMFYDAEFFKGIPLGFDTSSVQDMRLMFYNNRMLEQRLPPQFKSLPQNVDQRDMFLNSNLQGWYESWKAGYGTPNTLGGNRPFL